MGCLLTWYAASLSILQTATTQPLEDTLSILSQAARLPRPMPAVIQTSSTLGGWRRYLRMQTKLLSWASLLARARSVTLSCLTVCQLARYGLTGSLSFWP